MWQHLWESGMQKDDEKEYPKQAKDKYRTYI